MCKIKTLGIIEIASFEFLGIEGGFGENKKCILAKDIASIHNRKLKHINELINNNIKRFKQGLDILDLLGVGLDDPKIISDFSFSQQAINSYRGMKNKGLNSGIYILSERGYAKLLKIMDDDLAWEIYDKFVDDYFNMRKEISNISNVDKLLLDIVKSETIPERSLALNDYLNKVVKPLEKKASYHDLVLNCKGTVKTTIIAKDYGMTAIKFNKLLHDLKIQFKQGGIWLLYKEHANKGYTKSKTIVYQSSNGDPKTTEHTEWTQKGRKFIYEILKENGILPMIEKDNIIEIA